MPDRKLRGDDAGTVGEFEYKKGFKYRSESEYCVEGQGVNNRYSGPGKKDNPPKSKPFTTKSLA